MTAAETKPSAIQAAGRVEAPGLHLIAPRTTGPSPTGRRSRSPGAARFSCAGCAGRPNLGLAEGQSFVNGILGADVGQEGAARHPHPGLGVLHPAPDDARSWPTRWRASRRTKILDPNDPDGHPDGGPGRSEHRRDALTAARPPCFAYHSRPTRTDRTRGAAFVRQPGPGDGCGPRSSSRATPQRWSRPVRRRRRPWRPGPRRTAPTRRCRPRPSPGPGARCPRAQQHPPCVAQLGLRRSHGGLHVRRTPRPRALSPTRTLISTCWNRSTTDAKLVQGRPVSATIAHQMQRGEQAVAGRRVLARIRCPYCSPPSE